MPETLISGVVSRFKSSFGFPPNTNLHSLKVPMFGVLNVLYANAANGQYFGHI